MMSKQGREQNRVQKAAAIRAEQERRERNRRVGLVAGIVVLLCAIVAGGFWYSSSGGSTPSVASGDATVTASTTALKVGKKDAPVKVVIYEDYQCPFCRELENSTRTFLRENAAKGKVLVEYQPVNLLAGLPYSSNALNAWLSVLQTGTPKAALKLHDLLYDNQPYEQDSAKVTLAQIGGWVKDAGGDDAAARDAMKNPDGVVLGVLRNLMASQGIQGTPTVLVNDKLVSATSMSDMAKKIESAVDNG
jgi:protein-disulfide isomerase